MKKIVVASYNKNKVKELQELLANPNLELIDLSQLPDPPTWEETGSTFEENALIKARAIAEKTSFAVLADDSGLCVAALGGGPGVYSARFAGLDASDEENNLKLLKLMEGKEDRSAFFLCCLVLLRPRDKTIVVEGRCEGVILPSMQGRKGFGYDPLFFFPPASKTFAELEPEEKNKVSHRFKAVEKLRSFLV